MEAKTNRETPAACASATIARLPLDRGFGRPLEDARALRSIGSLLRRHRFDVVHAHSAKAGVLGRIAARAAGSPRDLQPSLLPVRGPVGPAAADVRHGGRARAGPDQRRDRVRRRGRAPARARAPADGAGAPPRRPQRVAASDAGIPADPELEAFAGGRPLAGCIAVLRPQKAVHVFVEAAPQILAAVPEARLAVIGEGEELPRLRALAQQLGLPADRFGFFDFHPPAARALRALDVFVLPSAWEALPISLLEALAEGVPQVATDVGGSGEAVADAETGLLCPPGDPAGLARAVAALLADPGRREHMGAASRQRHAAHFRVEEMARRTALVYDRVALPT